MTKGARAARRPAGRPAGRGDRPQDRREFPRINRSIRLRYTVAEQGPLPISGEAETRNLSRTGIGILLDEPVPVGTLLDVELRFPFSPIPFTARGRVIWVEKEPAADGRYPAGLRFTEVTMDGGDLVARVFRNHLGL